MNRSEFLRYLAAQMVQLLSPPILFCFVLTEHVVASTVLTVALQLHSGDEDVFSVLYQGSRILQSWILIWEYYQIFFILGFKMFQVFHFVITLSVPFSAN